MCAGYCLKRWEYSPYPLSKIHIYAEQFLGLYIESNDPAVHYLNPKEDWKDCWNNCTASWKFGYLPCKFDCVQGFVLGAGGGSSVQQLCWYLGKLAFGRSTMFQDRYQNLTHICISWSCRCFYSNVLLSEVLI